MAKLPVGRNAIDVRLAKKGISAVKRGARRVGAASVASDKRYSAGAAGQRQKVIAGVKAIGRASVRSDKAYAARSPIHQVKRGMKGL